MLPKKPAPTTRTLTADKCKSHPAQFATSEARHSHVSSARMRPSIPLRFVRPPVNFDPTRRAPSRRISPRSNFWQHKGSEYASQVLHNSAFK